MSALGKWLCRCNGEKLCHGLDTMHKAGKITALDGSTFRGNLDAVELGFFELT